MSFFETRELHRKEELRTNWYQCTYQDAKKAIFAIAEELGYGVIDVNDTFHVMLLEGPHVVVVKITSYGRYEQGIDFAISTKWLVDLGRSKALVRRLYSHIAKHVKFKGVSLHP